MSKSDMRNLLEEGKTFNESYLGCYQQNIISFVGLLKYAARVGLVLPSKSSHPRQAWSIKFYRR